jgi:DNA-binding transcriptional MerR regulator
MKSYPHSHQTAARPLKIGEAAALTGVTRGRIRHYQDHGLVQPSRSLTGYRHFDSDDLLRLLQIDLLRGLGMSLDDIRRSLPGPARGDSLRATLQQHRETLRTERARLDRLMTAIELALEADEADPEAVVALLSSANSTKRDSLGIFGRLSRPLSEAAAAAYQELLGGGWGLPVPSIFGRMLLPAQVSELLEQVAAAPGHPELFRRIRILAGGILELSAEPDPDPAAPHELAKRWIDSLEEDPLPGDVRLALDRTLPRIRQLDLLNQGFQLWAESISPSAAEFLRDLEHEVGARALVVLGVLIATPSRRRPRPRPLPRPGALYPPGVY